MMKYADIRNGLRSRLAVFTRLMLTLCVPMTRAADGNSLCGFKELQQCARPLRVLASAQDLLFVRDLDTACQDLQAGLRCVHRYARTCMSHAQAEHLARLYRGTQATVRELCAEGPYRREFLRHARCSTKANAAYGECTGRFRHVLDNLENLQRADDTHMKIIAADVNKRRDVKMREQMVIDKVDIHVPTYAPLRNAAGKQVRNAKEFWRSNNAAEIAAAAAEEERERLRPLCCAFKRLDGCAFDVMRSTCGSDTAYFVSDFLRGMSANAMRMHCALFEEEAPQTCGEDLIEEPLLLEVAMKSSASVHSTWCGLIIAILFWSLR